MVGPFGRRQRYIKRIYKLPDGKTVERIYTAKEDTKVRPGTFTDRHGKKYTEEEYYPNWSKAFSQVKRPYDFRNTLANMTGIPQVPLYEQNYQRGAFANLRAHQLEKLYPKSRTAAELAGGSVTAQDMYNTAYRSEYGRTGNQTLAEIAGQKARAAGALSGWLGAMPGGRSASQAIPRFFGGAYRGGATQEQMQSFTDEAMQNPNQTPEDFSNMVKNSNLPETARQEYSRAYMGSPTFEQDTNKMYEPNGPQDYFAGTWGKTGAEGSIEEENEKDSQQIPQGASQAPESSEPDTVAPALRNPVAQPAQNPPEVVSKFGNLPQAPEAIPVNNVTFANDDTGELGPINEQQIAGEVERIVSGMVPQDSPLKDYLKNIVHNALIEALNYSHDPDQASEYAFNQMMAALNKLYPNLMQQNIQQLPEDPYVAESNAQKLNPEEPVDNMGYVNPPVDEQERAQRETLFKEHAPDVPTYSYEGMDLGTREDVLKEVESLDKKISEGLGSLSQDELNAITRKQNALMNILSQPGMESAEDIIGARMKKEGLTRKNAKASLPTNFYLNHPENKGEYSLAISPKTLQHMPIIPIGKKVDILNPPASKIIKDVEGNSYIRIPFGLLRVYDPNGKRPEERTSYKNALIVLENLMESGQDKAAKAWYEQFNRKDRGIISSPHRIGANYSHRFYTAMNQLNKAFGEGGASAQNIGDIYRGAYEMYMKMPRRVLYMPMLKEHSGGTGGKPITIQDYFMDVIVPAYEHYRDSQGGK